jgi:hypothetical protein
MARTVKLLALVCCLTGVAAYAGPVFVSSPAAMGANDTVKWSQLGGDGTLLGTTFTATSADGNVTHGTLTGPNSIIAVVCPAKPSCSWSPASPPAFNAGDSLIWTSNGNGGGNGPLTLTFSAVFGAGAYLQADAPGQFTAHLQVFYGATSIGENVTSDTKGDPVFLGALDKSKDITEEVFSLTSCSPGCNTADFAIDTLFFNNTGKVVPEPRSFAYVVIAIGLLLVRTRIRSVLKFFHN